MPILSLIVWTPVVGVLTVLLLPKHRPGLIKAVALACSGISLLLSFGLLLGFDSGSSDLQFTERREWIPELGMSYSLGVDGLSLPLVLLTSLMAMVALVASIGESERVKGYFAWFLLLEFSMLGVFMAQDWFLFYVFFEVGLVPMFFLIGLWGSERRDLAAMSFFLYTLAGSILILLGIIAVYLHAEPNTFDMRELEAQAGGWTQSFQIAPFLAFFVGFAVKIPAFPLHGWLPLAHVEAPTPVSIVLSAVLLKMGVYGLLRVSGVLPLGIEWFAPALMVVALVTIIYGALLAWRQTDLKAMVAFSSINHMGFCLMGIAALNSTGFTGATLQMVTHGIITGALFLLVGALYERTHVRDVNAFGGLATRVPRLAVLMSLALLASMGLPGLAQFVSEFHALVGAYERFGLYIVVGSVGILIAAAYSLRAIGAMFMGPLNPRWSGLPDLRRSELAAAVPLAVAMIVLGLYPSLLLDLMNTTLERMAEPFE